MKKNNNHEVRQFHDAYGYDLKAALEKFNMRDIKEPDPADIPMASLKKGNIHAVAMEKDGGAVRMFVEANPQYKTVNLYDSGFHRVPKEELEKYQMEGRLKVNSKEVDKGKGREKEVGQAVLNEKGKGQSEKRKEKTKGPEVLLPKKSNTEKNNGVKIK